MLISAAAQAQTSASGAPALDETYLVDSKGVTVYRNGSAACGANCAIRPAAGEARRPEGAPQFSQDPASPRPFSFHADAGRPPSLSLPLPRPAVAAVPTEQPPEKAEARFTKEQKALMLNAGVAAGVTAYGVGFWDWFQTEPKASSEGWFGRTTDHGGMDKLGHFWTTYSVSHLYSYLYRWWDFSPETANGLGALSSLGVQTAIEVGDAFSGGFGFSYEDALMNALGAGTAYILGRYPELARKIDFRLEYKPSDLSDLTDDVATDYENQRYLLAIKLDGFDIFHETYLSYLELHAGYQARGYEDFVPGSAEDDRRRSFYFGVGFNVSKLVRQYTDIGIFDYVQVPYTSVGVTSGLD